MTKKPTRVRPQPKWIIKQKSKVKTVLKAYFDPKEFRFDPAGYFLIRTNRKKKMIEVALCTYKHVIIAKVSGKCARDVYYTILRNRMISHHMHSAYLGSELQKADIALNHGLEYVQDSPLNLKKKTRKDSQ